MTNVQATKAGTGRRRRPKTFDEGRICRDESCDTMLSRYNRSDLCFNHAPTRFPRLRGEFTAEYLASHGDA